MTHQVTLTEYRQLSDGKVAVQACCCGDDSTLSWHTMATNVVLDDAAREASINEHVQRVATLHETTLQALAKLPSLLGTAIEVILPTPAPAPPPVPPAPAAQTSAVQ